MTGGGGTSAEVYDPATGTWTPTTAMATARDHSAAVLLPNGNVLVAGGDNVANKSSSQIYQPLNGVWLPKVDMGVLSDRPALAVLNTGKVLAAGGSVKIAQLYDLTTDTWTNTGSTAQEHPLNGIASLLPDGRVLLSGGLFGTGDRATEIFDPAAGSAGLADGDQRRSVRPHRDEPPDRADPAGRRVHRPDPGRDLHLGDGADRNPAGLRKSDRRHVTPRNGDVR